MNLVYKYQSCMKRILYISTTIVFDFLTVFYSGKTVLSKEMCVKTADNMKKQVALKALKPGK